MVSRYRLLVVHAWRPVRLRFARRYSVNNCARYTVCGALFGCCFPIFSLALLILSGEVHGAHGILQTVAQAHATNSLLHVIDTAPFFLGVFAGFAGHRQDHVERQQRAAAHANKIVQNSSTILYRLSGEPPFPLLYVSSNITKLDLEPVSKPNWTDIQTLVDPRDRPRVAAALTAMLEQGAEGGSVELRLQSRSGGLLWVENRYTPIRDTGGRLIEVEGIITDITERKAAEEKIALLVGTDPLTNLANRATFLQRIRQEFAATTRGASPFAILYLDLDYFKPVNDTLGHAAGDELLQEVAVRLNACTRETDLVARLGGDEFAVLQAGIAEPASAGVLAAKIVRSLALPYSLDDNNEVRISASIGICPHSAGSPSADAMLAQADLALYRSKDEGRNRYRFYSDDLDQEMLERVALAAELRTALDCDTLELRYQPQVELVSGAVIGMKLLVRWNHPTRGRLEARDCVSIAEQTGTSVALWRWVLDRACRQMRLWRDEGVIPPAVGIAVSQSQLKNGPDFLRDVRVSLAKWDLVPSDLELDVTEATLAQVGLTQNDALCQLSEIGVKIAIDDFGGKYSSLDYLRTYRINHIELARSSILAAIDQPDRTATIRAIIHLAQDIGIGVVAQGLETAEQRALLVSSGSAALGRGFVFNAAVSAEGAGKFSQQGSIEPIERASPPPVGGLRPESRRSSPSSPCEFLPFRYK
jgi:diguanylate cyclase (GGDEF)-like protein